MWLDYTFVGMDAIGLVIALVDYMRF